MKNLNLHDGFCEDITILRIFPGMDTAMVDHSLQPPIKGVVLQTFGAGNAPDADPSLMKALKTACDRGVVIVNVTQCYTGGVEAHYATGVALCNAGVVPGLDMTCEAALVKLG